MGQDAIIGIATVAIAVIGAAVVADKLAGRDPLHCEERQHATRYAYSAPDRGAVDPAYQRPDCNAPKNEKEADLCAQRRMAYAAEQAECIARWQAWLSAFRLGGLLLTIIYAARSSRAATKAAREAVRAVDVQVRVEQPLVFITKTKPQRSMLGGKGSVRYTVENIGNTPAVLHKVSVACEVRSAIPTHPVYVPEMPADETVLKKGDSWSSAAQVIGANGIEVALDGELPVFLWGYVLYEDVFGRIRMTGFGYKVEVNKLLAEWGDDDPVLRRQRAGGAAYNYDYPNYERRPETA